MKKRLVGFITLAVFVIMLFAGCSGGGAPKVDSTQNKGDVANYDVNNIEEWAKAIKAQYDGTSVKIAAATHPSINAFKKMTPEFEKMTGITVVWDEMQENALMDKLLVEGEATSYDIVMTCPEFMPSQIDLNALYPLDEYISDKNKTPQWYDYEDLMEAYRLMLSHEGKTYGVPFAGETVFTMYRKDVFDELGLEVPKTMSDLLNTAKILKEKKPDNYGITFRVRLGWEFCYMYSCFMFPFGGAFINPTDGSVVMNSPENKKALQFMNDILEYGPVGIKAFSFDEAWSSFMTGDALMTIEASAAAAEFENPEKSVAAGKIGYAPMPEGPAGGYSGVWGWGFAITNASKNKDAAWAAIAYLTSKEKQNEYLENGGIVSRGSALKDPEEQAKHPYYKAILDTLDQAAALQAKGYSVVLPIPEWSQISEIVGTTGSRALTGEISIDEALESMQTQIEDALKK
jgi:multiple sugar transport system substrate-binding protein